MFMIYYSLKLTSQQAEVCGKNKNVLRGEKITIHKADRPQQIILQSIIKQFKDQEIHLPSQNNAIPVHSID